MNKGKSSKKVLYINFELSSPMIFSDETSLPEGY